MKHGKILVVDDNQGIRSPEHTAAGAFREGGTDSVAKDPGCDD